ncbi:MAG: M20/M25/M40 family metallo-hydrolase, partial [Thermoanaerobaculales bacterium]|nr:M20/M25/M40 family metallo-hydrolase [Thermoanaerobaculales bacterium]
DAGDSDERYEARLESAKSLGAVAVLVVERDNWEGHLEDGRETARRFFLPFGVGSGADDGLPMAVVSAAVAEALFGAGTPDSDAPLAAQPKELPGFTVTINASASERLVESRNVFGVIAGSDPELRGEVVMIGAHIDHLGRVGETVYPGADDNGSGVAALIEIAKACATSPVAPKRTLAFAFWTGEEEGKLGSGSYLRHPLWPLESTTYVNLDMIGHPWLPEEIRKLVADTGLEQGDELLTDLHPGDFIEPGLPDGAPQLDAALRRAASGTGLALHFDRTDGTSGGSDYRDFARAGVPFIRFFGNFFPAYHEPGDTAEALDAEQVQRVAGLALATAWLLADR